MPGFSLRINYYADRFYPLDKTEKILHSLLHNKDYSVKELIKNDNILAVFTGYEYYPLIKFKFSDYDIFIEGKIYNKNYSSIEKTLKELFDKPENLSDEIKIKNCLTEFEGEFIILIHHKVLKKILILNDLLGRLPFYTYADKYCVLISRELKFIFQQTDQKQIEPFSLAECMLFGYPLGNKTFFKNIYRTPPASFIEIDLQDPKLSVKQVSDFQFENKENSGRKIESVTTDLADLFIEGTKNRVSNESTNILSLSGGLDSRSVLGALKFLKTDFKATSFVGYNKVTENDAQVASLLSKELCFPWEVMNINNPLGKDLLALLTFKDGTNTLGQSFLTIYYRTVMEKYGQSVAFFTGDGGDKAFPDHRPSLNLRNTQSLVQYTVSNKYFFKIKKISQLLSINEKEIIDHLSEHFSGYPEVNPNYKFMRFIIAERGIKWLFETEDKNRFFFWTNAPMYSYPFFNYAVNVPEELKTNHTLYYSFLRKINPDSLKFKNALWGVHINPDNFRYKSFLFAKDRVYPRLPSYVKKVLRKRLIKFDDIHLNKNPVIKKILDEVSDKESVKSIFNSNALTKIQILGRAELYILLTLLLAAEYYFESSSTLANYLQEEFV